MALPAGHPGAAVAGIGGQQLPQHAAARLQHPGADHGLGGLQAGIAAQRPGRFGGQAAYLSRFLPRERLEESPFSPSGTGSPSVPVTGLTSQIFSFTSAICSLIAANSPCRATSRRTFSTSAAAKTAALTVAIKLRSYAFGGISGEAQDDLRKIDPTSGVRSCM